MLARTLLLQTERDPGMIHPEVLWAEVVDIAGSVLERDPMHAECRLLRAQAYYLLGQWDNAQREADEAVRRHPDRAGAHVLVGRLASDRFRKLLGDAQKVQDDERAYADAVKKLHEQAPQGSPLVRARSGPRSIACPPPRRPQQTRDAGRQARRSASPPRERARHRSRNVGGPRAADRRSRLGSSGETSTARCANASNRARSFRP